MNNQLLFAMYNSYSDTVEVNITTNIVLIISCKHYNNTITFEHDNDIVYLYQLAEELPFTYAKLAMQENGLQNYVDAISSLN